MAPWMGTASELEVLAFFLEDGGVRLLLFFLNLLFYLLLYCD